jgi:glucosamine--fructose-6-phosphate aminotransferase (isomerizing)
MCGIVGYIGKKPLGISVVLGGLQALEYRGYDSAGVAYQTGQVLVTNV